MSVAELTLIGKPGCHLCDDAREVIESVVNGLRNFPGAPELVIQERSIMDDSAAYDQYVEDIPVVLINGRVHTFWRVDPVRLRSALLGVR